MFDRRNGPPTGGRGYDHRIRRREPRSKQTVFKPDLGTRIASMMATVGFYERRRLALPLGLPAKTGVGGGIMGVVPGVMGVAAFAPPLDDAGNSGAVAGPKRLVWP